MKEPRLTPRKAPRQGRAKSTVDAILIATSRILVADGFEVLSTNRVAELAGVSVGTLYQYFPSKESLVTAVDRHLRSLRLSSLLDALVALGEASLDDVARAIASSVVGAYGKDTELAAVLETCAPAIGTQRKTADLDASFARALAATLERHPAALQGRDAAKVGYLLARAIDGLLRAVIRDHSPWLAEEWLVLEVASLVRGYVSARL